MINKEDQNKRVLTSYLYSNSVIEEALEAMKQGQIIPYFQPKYNYDTKQWCGSEALVRWIHPEIGFLPLDFFIPIFEKSGQIMQLDLFVLEEVCMYQQRWKEQNLSVLPVSVNFSQLDFKEPDFTDRVMSILNRYQMTCNDIRFEITETAYMQGGDNIKEFIRRVHDKNFCVDMDDFGSGYSSLSMLDEIQVDSIKLDMNMTRKAGTDRRCGHILSAVTRLANELGIDVLAEGVETKVQADYLSGIGCTYMQGFYFSKPLSPMAYELLLENKDEQYLIETTNQQFVEDEYSTQAGLQQAYEKHRKYAKRKRSDSKTGYTGVSVTPEGKYRADITFQGNRYFLGKFDSLDEAVSARKQAEKLNDEFFAEYYLMHPRAARKMQ